MTERISPEQFNAAGGLDDWRVIDDTAFSYFRTTNFAAGLALVNEIGRLAEAADHHPDIDLRYQGVTVGITTHFVGGLSQRDIDLARQMSAAAAALGISADSAVIEARAHVND